MFIHDNGRVCVLAMTRCGHTNMYHHFGIQPYGNDTALGFHPWLQSTSKRVVVLRDPYERVASAKRLCDMESWHNFEVHSRPYMHYLFFANDFKVIDFSMLSEYIGRVGKQSPRTDSSDSIGYVPNDDYTEEDLETEYQIYKSFMAMKEKITPVEWKELTSD